MVRVHGRALARAGAVLVVALVTVTAGVASPAGADVQGPAIVFDTDVVVPGATVTIFDGGGCGERTDWASVHVTVQRTFNAGAPHTADDFVLDVDAPLGPDGRWGPYSFVVPADTTPFASFMAFSACVTTAFVPEVFQYGFLLSETTVPQPPPVRVSLGDSYSSGEGNDPFDAGTDVFWHGFRLDGCHRSPQAWPRTLGVTAARHLACSGAVIGDLYAGKERRAPDNVAQLTRLSTLHAQQLDAGDPIDSVTLTIGGNDLGFSGVLLSCWVRRGCLADYDAKVRDVDRLEDSIVAALRSIDARSGTAQVVLVGYPRLFPADQSGNVACTWLSPTERVRANTLSTMVDLMERRAATRAGATFVSVQNVLAGHELCTADSWMFPFNPAVWGGDQRQAHPLAPGQQAIAAAVGPQLVP